MSKRRSKKEIIEVITQHMSGTPMAEIGRKMDMAKSLVKYYVDNANKFLPAEMQERKAPVISKLLKRGELLGWRKFVQLISLGRKTIDEMNGTQRIEAAEKLKNILVGLAGHPQGIGHIPENIVEMSEKESKLVVKNWTRKNMEQSLKPEGEEPSAGAETVGEVVDVTLTPEGDK